MQGWRLLLPRVRVGQRMADIQLAASANTNGNLVRVRSTSSRTAASALFQTRSHTRTGYTYWLKNHFGTYVNCPSSKLAMILDGPSMPSDPSAPLPNIGANTRAPTGPVSCTSTAAPGRPSPVPTPPCGRCEHRASQRAYGRRASVWSGRRAPPRRRQPWQGGRGFAVWQRNHAIAATYCPRVLRAVAWFRAGGGRFGGSVLRVESGCYLVSQA